MKAVAYCRYSSDLQRDGFSIEAQLSAIHTYCEQEGITLIAEYIDEARSGTTAERESFQRMIADSAKREFELVIVHKLDRFSRDRYDFAVYRKILRDHGVALRSVVERLDDSPESIILEGMLESMAEYYSRNLSRETIKGLRARAAKGLASSNRPLGYDIVDGRFVINQGDALIVKEIFSRVNTGESLASIARDLTKRGIRGNRGGVLKNPSLAKIIGNTIYYGDYTFAGEVVAVEAAEPIIDFETWTAANAKLRERKRPAYKRFRQADYLLSGLLYCGLCGGHYTGHVSTSRGRRYERYRCTNSAKKTCSASVVRKDKMENFVIEAIKSDLLEANFVKDAVAQLKARLKAKRKDSDLSALNKERNALKLKNDRLLDLYLDMKLDKDTYVRRAAELNDKLNKIEVQIKAITTSTTAISEASFRAAIKYYFESLKIKSPDNLSILVNTFIERVILYPDRVVIIYKFKDAKGNYVKSNKGAVLNINSGGVYSRLSAEYSVSSYRDLLFNAGDLIKYTILV